MRIAATQVVKVSFPAYPTPSTFPPVRVGAAPVDRRVEQLSCAIGMVSRIPKRFRFFRVLKGETWDLSGWRIYRPLFLSLQISNTSASWPSPSFLIVSGSIPVGRTRSCCAYRFTSFVEKFNSILPTSVVLRGIESKRQNTIPLTILNVTRLCLEGVLRKITGPPSTTPILEKN
jgi:hypothetical protein